MSVRIFWVVVLVIALLLVGAGQVRAASVVPAYSDAAIKESGARADRVVAYGQSVGSVGWSVPTNLSDTPGESEGPAIVADPTGMVHLFWSENTDASTNVANAIFYSRWDGQAWSRAHDILMSPEGARALAAWPSAVMGPDGRINLAWEGGWGGTVYFSSARADEAIGARAWRQPVAVGRKGIGASQPRLALGPGGRLHLTYAVATGAEQGIYHASSEDGGGTWSTPALIPGTRQGGDRALFHPRLAAGADGSLHVAWTWAYMPETFPPQGVLYARSADGGVSWSEPLAIATGPYGWPELAAVGEQEVHLVWCGTTTDRHKFHQWSQDGGQTWSQRTTILEIGGFQGYAGMAFDGAGRPHLALIGGHPQFGDVVYHLAWNGAGWSPPQVVLRITAFDGPPPQNPRNSAIAISNGNVAHIVAEMPLPAVLGGQAWQMDILVSSRLLDAPATAPQPLPTVTPTRAAQATPVERQRAWTATPAAPATAPTPLPSFAGRAAPVRELASPTDAISAGLIPVVLLLAAVIIAQARRR